MSQATAIQAPHAHRRDEMVALLHDYVRDQLLDGDANGLDERTPLLQWGVIDSLAMVELLGFIEERFGVRVPDEEVKPEHFQNLGALSDHLLTLDARGGAAAAADPGAPLCALEQRGVRALHVATKGGAALHLLHTPPRQGRPRWLILPAAGSPASAWGGMLRNLVGEQEAAALDWPGFGLSSLPGREARFADQREAAIGALDALAAPGPGPVVLIGHAAGALVAAEVARARPERVHALVIIGFGQPEGGEAARAWISALRTAAIDPAAFLGRAHHQPAKITAAQRHAIEEALASPAYRAFLDEEAAIALERGLSGIQAPTLVVAGEDDRFVPRDSVERAAAQVPGARVEWLARCGHQVPVERPQELLMFINLFLYGRSK